MSESHFLRGHHYRTMVPLVITVDESGVIAAIHPGDDAESTILAPGLCDIQINGGLGVSFNTETLTVADVHRVVDHARDHGTTRLVPTLVTNSETALTTALKILASVAEANPAIVGFHLEGPAISPLDGPRGAHPREHVRRPNWDEFQRLQSAAEGRIRIVTLAPEHDESTQFIERLTAAGVIAAIGHTAATGAQIRDAVRAGAKLSTHLGNGIAATLPRHANPIWEQLDHDELWVSLIADEHHLPGPIFRSIIRLKKPMHSILVSDASSLAGLPPGRYREWGQDLEVMADGKVIVAGTEYLAGSAVFLDGCVAGAMRMGVPLAAAIEMAAISPRNLLGIPVPKLQVGELNEWVSFDQTASTVAAKPRRAY